MTTGRAGSDQATGSAPSLVTHAEAAMGTVFSFTVVPGTLPATAVRAALDSACATLHWTDTVFSTWDRQSPVSLLRRGEATLSEMPAEVAEVLTLCETAKRASCGWFDPWALPGGVDPTGLVKGWAVDRALAVLRAARLPAALVNGGGDLAAFGCPAPGLPWRIGIRHPWRPAALAGIIEVRAAVATSGTYERGAHLIDPHTGQPGSRAVSATVTGPSLAMADALATAVAVGGDLALDAVAALEGYQGYLIRPDGTEADTGGITFVS